MEVPTVEHPRHKIDCGFRSGRKLNVLSAKYDHWNCWAFFSRSTESVFSVFNCYICTL